jgi:hypothetical protein
LIGVRGFEILISLEKSIVSRLTYGGFEVSFGERPKTCCRRAEEKARLDFGRPELMKSLTGRLVRISARNYSPFDTGNQSFYTTLMLFRMNSAECYNSHMRLDGGA